MRTLWIALAALVGFVVSFFMILFLGIGVLTNRSECDGPCFSEWGKVFWTAIAIGLAVGATLGVAAYRRTRPDRKRTTTWASVNQVNWAALGHW